MPGFANDVSCDDALRSSEADLVEIQVGMLRADMMKDAGDGTADAGVEALHRIDVDGVTNILTTGMLHGLVLGKALTNGHECFPLVAHQMSARFDLRFNDAFACSR